MTDMLNSSTGMGGEETILVTSQITCAFDHNDITKRIQGNLNNTGDDILIYPAGAHDNAYSVHIGDLLFKWKDSALTSGDQAPLVFSSLNGIRLPEHVLLKYPGP